MTSFQPMLDLELEPTVAMQAGKQLVFQCSWCGCVVVQTETPGVQLGSLGDCPSCRRVAPWWGQALPLAGLRARTAVAA